MPVTRSPLPILQAADRVRIGLGMLGDQNELFSRSLTLKRWWGVSEDGKGRGEWEENEVPENLASRKGIITEWQGPR